MPSWIKKINDAELKELSTVKKKLLTEKNISLIFDSPKTYLYQNEEVEQICGSLSVRFFEKEKYSESFLIWRDEILVQSFFYNSLKEKGKHELISFLLFNHITKQDSFKDLLIEISEYLEPFLSSRKKILADQEFHALYEINKKDNLIYILGIVFVSLMHYADFQERLNLIEKKNLKEIFFTEKLKKILGLKKDAFEYIYKKHYIKKQDEDTQDKFFKIKQIIDDNRIDLMDYVNERLINKKILFWGIWTISPYLAVDISQLIVLLSQTKFIKRIYLDLPDESEVNLKKYLNSDFSSVENKIDDEIKKLYPSFIEDYAKETLPYINLLEKIKLFNIPFFVNGFSAEELVYKVPRVVNEELVFDNEKLWQESISLELSNYDRIADNEIVIFFYFIKPMHYFISELSQNEKIEKLLHGDPYLGYGPDQAENSIALYSQYSGENTYSFVLENIKQFFFKDEIINHYPQSAMLPYPIKNSHFNEFKVFDSFLYSGFKGGGGLKNEFTPTPEFDRILS